MLLDGFSLAKILMLLCTLYFLTPVVFGKPSTQPLNEKANLTSNSSKIESWTPDSAGNQTALSGKFQGDNKLRNGISTRQTPIHRLWPYGVIPYKINNAQFSHSDVSNIRQAMNILENVLTPRGIHGGSCQIKFVPVTRYHKHYLDIIDTGPGQCYSQAVGMHGGRHVISLGRGCVDVSSVLHELCHALGLEHEHSAPNRDDYVTIHWENIMQGKEYFFNKVNRTEFSDYGFDYDFKSIMHYNSYSYSKKCNGVLCGPTITAHDPTIKIEDNRELSETDKLKLELLYCKPYTLVKPNGWVNKQFKIKLDIYKEMDNWGII